MNTEIIQTIPANEYHNATRNGEYLSSHMLIDFLKNPKLYHQKMTGEIEQVTTEAMFHGSATHTLVLEGNEKFNREYMVSDGLVNPKTGEFYGKSTKAYRDWLTLQPLPIVTTNEFARMQNMRRAVWGHKEASDILAFGIAEGVVRFEVEGVPCQSRYDWIDLDRNLFADLKTCECLDGFERDAYKYGYIEQMAFYRMGLKAHGIEDPAVFIIAVEKIAPYRCGVFALAAMALDIAEKKIKSGVSELKGCWASSYYPTRYEEVRVLDYPAWVYNGNNN